MFGHNSFSWNAPLVFNAGTYADEDYTGEYLIIKGHGSGVAAFYQDGTRHWGGTYTSGTRTEAIEALVAILPDGTYYKIEEGTGMMTTAYEEGLAAAKENAEKIAALENMTDEEIAALANSNGASNGDLDPEPCDDSNRETKIDGSCGSSCKTGYAFDSSSADAKCVLVESETGAKWPSIIGVIAVIGIGSYLVFSKRF